ncbi:MAG TPA: PrsW family intramembrane metalloprotease [Bacteroidales bacterium]|nr:PrsW family intramembrane metalloprotease [Bacteroidales bacterium]
MKTLVIVTLSFAGLILLLNTTVKNQEFSNPVDNINFLIKTDNLYKAEAAYRAELQNHTDNIDLHYGYVTNHFNLPEKIKTGKHSYKYRDDETIMNYYNTLANETDIVKKDMGNYLLGLCYSYKNDNDNAIKYFKRVKNRNLKYLNNSTGVIYKDRNQLLAIKFFEKEIEIDGNLDGAVFNLSKVLIANADADKFGTLIRNPKTTPYIKLSHKREFYYLKHDFFNYFKTVWQKFVSTIDSYGFLGALAIALIWLFYLRHIDIYERERWYNIGVVFVLSLMLTEGCYLMYDFANVSLHFNLNGNILNDLAYCVFGIGLIEEITKLVPLLIFLSFSKAVNEPIDYVIYASVSALGFAFMENIQYFQNDRYYIMHGRALASVVAHMCFSSIVAWGFIVSKYKAHYKAFVT